MDELIATLLVWISLQVGCQPPAPPRIEQVTPQQMAMMVYQCNPPPDASVIAVYDKRQRLVYLSHQWRAESVADRSSLLHELVHHVQEAACMPYPCPAARERLA